MPMARKSIISGPAHQRGKPPAHSGLVIWAPERLPVAKITGKEGTHLKGQARCFGSEEEARHEFWTANLWVAW